MAGLLGSYQVDPLAQGLLGLSGALLTPRSQGGGVGAGFQAFNGGVLQAQQMQRQAQQDALRQQLLQAQIGQLDATAEERKFKMKALQDEQARRDRISRALSGLNAGQPAAPGANTPQAETPLTLGAGGGMLGPQGAELPSVQSPMFGTGPQSQPQGARPSRTDAYKSLMSRASIYEANGDPETALKLQEMAQKALPELKERATVLVNGKPTLMLVFKDGSREFVDDAAPTANVDLASFGGYKQLLNKDTGLLDGAQIPVTMDEAQKAADARARQQIGISAGNLALSRERFAFDRAQATDGGPLGKPPAGYRWNADGSLLPIPGGPADPARERAGAPTEDERKAAGWLAQADNAYKNMLGAMSRNPGAATPGIPDAIARVPIVGEPVGQLLRGEERQKFLQGASSLSEALLRAATGAGVNESEARQKVVELTPQIGDSAALRQQKMDAIPMYLESLKTRASRAAPANYSIPAAPPMQPAPAPGAGRNPMSGAVPGGQRVMRFDAQGNLVQ